MEKNRKNLPLLWPWFSCSVLLIMLMPKSVSSCNAVLLKYLYNNKYFLFTVLSTVMKQGEDKTSKLYYASSALTYLLAMVCSNMALQWVNYPTQVPRFI